MDSIRLKNMEFHKESSMGINKYLVDITLFLDLTKAGQTDDIEDTIDYVMVYEQIKDVVELSSCHLTERLANLIADRIWLDHRGAVGLSVSVAKEETSFKGKLEAIEIRVNRGTVD